MRNRISEGKEDGIGIVKLEQIIGEDKWMKGERRNRGEVEDELKEWKINWKIWNNVIRGNEIH